MKRTTLILASSMLVFAGCTCGGGRPNFFTSLHNRIHGVSNVGEPCDAGCHAAHDGCDTCVGSGSMNYGGYEGQVIDTYEGTPVTYGGTTTGSSTVPYNPQTFPSSSAPIVNSPRREVVGPKPAN